MWVGDDFCGGVNFAEYCFVVKYAKYCKGFIKPSIARVSPVLFFGS
jgi:hypothetical protein